MNSGVSARRAATHSWPASGPERPVRDPCPDRGGIGLGGAEAPLDGDQVPRGQRQMSARAGLGGMNLLDIHLFNAVLFGRTMSLCGGMPQGRGHGWID
jgi:hypothetical protein